MTTPKVNLIIESQSSDGVVHAVINGIRYEYTGLDSASVFKARQKAYKYKPGQLINWLKKHSTTCKRRCNMCTKTKSKWAEENAAMISAMKKFIASKKYNVITQGKSIKTKKCIGPKDKPHLGCGRRMMGAISPDKSKVFWICMHRFNTDELGRCTNWRKGKLPPKQEDKPNPVSKSIAGVPNNV